MIVKCVVIALLCVEAFFAVIGIAITYTIATGE